MKKLVLIGAGGHSKSVIDSLPNDVNLIGYIDEYKKGTFFGKPIFGNSFENVPEYRDCYYFVTIGDNGIREMWFEKILDLGLNTINIIDDTALVSRSSKIGKGNFIGKYAIINSDSEIGDNNIINTRSLIEHECKLGNNIHLSTGAVVNGNVEICNNVFLGSMSVCIGQLKVGKNSIVGAGGVVISDIPENVTAVGVPVRVIKEYK